jgi:hypothetical protein
LTRGHTLGGLGTQQVRVVFEVRFVEYRHPTLIDVTAGTVIEGVDLRAA